MSKTTDKKVKDKGAVNPALNSAGKTPVETDDFTAVLGRAHEGVLIADAQGHLLHTDNGFSDLSGYPPETLSQLQLNNLFNSPDIKKLTAKVENRKSSRGWEANLLRNDGIRVQVEVASSSFQWKGESCILVKVNERSRDTHTEGEQNEQEKLFTTLFQSSPVAKSILTKDDYKILDVNEACSQLFGYTRAELIGRSSADLNLWNMPAERQSVLNELLETDQLRPREKMINTRSGETRIVSVSMEAVLWKGKACLLTSVFDITTQKHYEFERDTALEFLRMMNASKDTGELIHQTTEYIQRISGCEAVGIRLERDQDFPYYETRGFPAEHIYKENSLCRRKPDGTLVRNDSGMPMLDCLCGHVILGGFDPAHPCITKKGSFWSNCQSELHISSADKVQPLQIRNCCNCEGYESVALIPLRVGDKALGLIQLNDKRKGHFNPQIIAMWERLADYLALSLSRFAVEDAHRESEEKLKMLIEYAPVALAMFDKSMRYVAVSGRWITDYHLDDQELIGRSHYEVFPEINEDIKAIHRRGLEGESLEDSSVKFERLDGSIQWISWAMRPWHRADGSIGGIVIFSEDITALKESEQSALESERQMTALLTSLDDIVFEFDEQGKYLNIWSADESKLAQPREKLLGRTMKEMLGDENGGRFTEAIRRVILQGRIETIEYPLETLSGMHWFLARISPIREKDGSHRTASMLVRDITDRKEAEFEIENQVKQLQALHTIDLAISSSVDMQTNLQILLGFVTNLVGVDAADVMVAEVNLSMFVYTAGVGFRTPDAVNARVPFGKSLVGEAAQQRRNIKFIGTDPSRLDPAFAAMWMHEGFMSYVGIPLYVMGELKGVLEIYQRSPLDLDAKTEEFLNILAGQAAIVIDSAQKLDTLHQSNLDLSLAYEATIEGWSAALDLRDRETEGHTLRVTDMTMRMAAAAGVPKSDLKHIRHGALLHDIGKLGVPDSVLHKPGPLDEEEWAQMRQHPLFAYQLLAPIQYLRQALDIPRYHHERWDGSGYPEGLKGKAIPLAARLFAIIDVYDALTSDRPYRQAWSSKQALDHIRAGAGTHFDPELVEVFMKFMASEKL